jgi:hypothetical protein
VAEPAVSVTVLPAPETVLPTVSVRPPRAPLLKSAGYPHCESDRGEREKGGIPLLSDIVD